MTAYLILTSLHISSQYSLFQCTLKRAAQKTTVTNKTRCLKVGTKHKILKCEKDKSLAKPVLQPYSHHLLTQQNAIVP
jgi:hypothetical protein